MPRPFVGLSETLYAYVSPEAIAYYKERPEGHRSAWLDDLLLRTKAEEKGVKLPPRTREPKKKAK